MPRSLQKAGRCDKARGPGIARTSVESHAPAHRYATRSTSLAHLTPGACKHFAGFQFGERNVRQMDLSDGHGQTVVAPHRSFLRLDDAIELRRTDRADVAHRWYVRQDKGDESDR